MLDLVAPYLRLYTNFWVVMLSAAGGMSAMTLSSACMATWVAGGLALGMTLLERPTANVALYEEDLTTQAFEIYIATLTIVFAVFGAKKLAIFVMQRFSVEQTKRVSDDTSGSGVDDSAQGRETGPDSQRG